MSRFVRKEMGCMIIDIEFAFYPFKDKDIRRNMLQYGERSIRYTGAG